MMDEENLGAEQDFYLAADSTQSHHLGSSMSEEDNHFNEAVMTLQEIILEEQFQTTQT